MDDDNAQVKTARVLVSWSTGKDSAWMLHQLRRQPGVEIGALVTTFNEEAARVAMHGVRTDLARAQAAAAGLPLWEVPLPWVCSNDEYDRRMQGIVSRARAEGFTHIAFGDLFLEDVRRYREERLAQSGLQPIFPLWGAETRSLAEEMIAAGLEAVVTCVDPRQVDARLAGRPFDAALLAALPDGADPCGEHGEFHTFAWSGPMFARPIPVRSGDIVERDGFVFADFLPDAASMPGGAAVEPSLRAT